MRAAITGGHGFLGWHLACRLRALHGVEPVRLGRADLEDPDRAADLVGEVDVVFHLAGVNRAETDDAVEAGNVHAAELLLAALARRANPPRVVLANTTQSLLDNPYGRGKARAAQLVRTRVEAGGGTVVDVLLPNVFGEHGRPRYNSFVATFCHLLATGGQPEVHEDREVPLLHAQAAAQALLDAALPNSPAVVRPAGRPTPVTEVLARLQSVHATYARGDLPDLTDTFDVDLFNTYRSYVFPGSFPRFPQLHADPRGELCETSRAHGGTSQTFVSTTRPARTRGDHYHLRKVERFFVVAGEAEIALRRLLDDEVVRFRLSGDRPGYVDMPTLWVHNITNVGQGDLVTVFWSDQLLDPLHPDQYPEHVEQETSA